MKVYNCKLLSQVNFPERWRLPFSGCAVESVFWTELSPRS